MKKILVVDDMLQWRNYHKSALNLVLKDEDFEIVLVQSAAEAKKIVLENLDIPFDLIISDLQMEEDYEPEYAGEWFVRNLQGLKQYANVPKIIVSAAPNIKIIAQQLNVDYLSKPTLIHNPLVYELKIRDVLKI